MNDKAVIYARFSSYGQTEQSIEGQLRKCYAFAEMQVLKVIEEYIDRAISVTTDKRPGFLQMIEDSKKKSFNYVIVYQLDRFARNRYDSATYKNKLKKNGVRVLSAKENITDDASGILVEGLLESMAEYYSAELSQKVKRGLNESLIKGYFLGGSVLFGYEIVDRKWTIKESEAVYVRKMFDDYIKGKMQKEIADELNEMGVRNKYGKLFTGNKISKIMTNKKYAGVYEFDDVEHTHIVPAIVSLNTFEVAKMKLEHNHHKKGGHLNAKVPYLLSGKMQCGYCEAYMTSETGTSKGGKVHKYYKCYSRKKDINSCDSKSYPKDYIENFVVDQTLEYVLKPDKVTELSKMIVKEFNESLGEDLVMKSLKSEMNEIDKNLGNLLKAVENGLYTSLTQDRIVELEKEKRKCDKKIARQETIAIKPLELDKVKNFIYSFATLDYTIANNRKRLIELFVRKAYCFKDRIMIFYNSSLNPEQEIKLEKKTENELLFVFGCSGGEWGIWTLARCYTPTVLAGPPLRPLE